MTPIAVAHKAEIIERMISGEPLTQIAKTLGYAGHSGIIERLGNDPDYQAALQAGVIAKLETREQELEKADEKVTVTRAGALLGHARWWAERLDPQRFGDKKADAGVKIAIQVVQIVADPQQSTAASPVTIDITPK